MLSSTQLFDIDTFNIASLEDEGRVDRLCHELLILFHADLVGSQETEPLLAGSMARGADYFLRDYMIDCQRRNIFHITPELLRSFGGYWYIINNIEPAMEELAPILSGVKQFYSYCHTNALISQEILTAISEVCNDHMYFRDRIESFFTLEDDGYMVWKSECPVS